jgi:hypothetical protein
VSYLARFLENRGFMGGPTDKTDKTPPGATETEVSSVLSVPSPGETKKSAPIPEPVPQSDLCLPAPHRDPLDPGVPPSGIRTEPIPAPRGWRDGLGWWPIRWRQKWADRAEALQVEGKTWQEAEWQSFLETVDQINAAEAASEVIEFTEPAPSDDAAAIQAILAWPLDDRTSWAELIESGRRHNEAVLARPAAKEQTPETPASIPDSLQQLDLFK